LHEGKKLDLTRKSRSKKESVIVNYYKKLLIEIRYILNQFLQFIDFNRIRLYYEEFAWSLPPVAWNLKYHWGFPNDKSVLW
jgi:hypothetical protein